MLSFSWPSVLSPNDHIEATRPHFPRIPCTKGVEGCVDLCWPWSEGEGGSSVQTKRRREPQAMWGVRWGVDGGCFLDADYSSWSFLVFWHYAAILGWLISAAQQKNQPPRHNYSTILGLIPYPPFSWTDTLSYHFMDRYSTLPFHGPIFYPTISWTYWFFCVLFVYLYFALPFNSLVLSLTIS
jgi:hypothetical protein